MNSGLWDIESGWVTCVPNEHVFFLPQKSFCVFGTLCDQLTYPALFSSENEPLSYYTSVGDGYVQLTGKKYGIEGKPTINSANLTVDDIRNALKTVNLEYMERRYGLTKEQNWTDILSKGEQQRIGSFLIPNYFF